MEPLKTNIKICVLLGLFAISDSFKAKFYAFVSNFLLTSNTVFLVSVSGAYFFKNVSDIEKATYAFYVIAAGLISLAWNAIVLKQQTAFKKMLLELQRMVVERITNGSSFHYEKVESYIQIFTIRYNIVFAIAVVASMVVMPVLVAAFHYIDGSYDYNSWYLPLVTMTPYNQQSTIGHIFSHIIQTTGISSLVSYLCAITMTYFGVCSYIEALFADLAQKYKKNDDDFLLKTILSHQKKLEATIKLKDNFVELIELHNNVLDFLNNFRDMLNGIVFSLFMVGIPWLCSGLFQLKPSWDLMFIQNMSQINLIVSCLYTYCSNGSTITCSCSEFARAIYNSHWYKYPIKLQPFVALIMCRAQKPFYFTGYEFGQCSMENFTALMKMSFSILMVLRAVNESR